jgi:Flp pilus assembly protein TadB
LRGAHAVRADPEYQAGIESGGKYAGTALQGRPRTVGTQPYFDFFAAFFAVFFAAAFFTGFAAFFAAFGAAFFVAVLVAFFVVAMLVRLPPSKQINKELFETWLKPNARAVAAGALGAGAT